MRRDNRNWSFRNRSLTVAALMLAAVSAPAADTRLEAVKTAPEPAPQQPPPNNWFNVRTPGRSALAGPNSFLQYGPPPEGACCPGRRCGHCLHQILAWATYCPKYRVCVCTECCNSCQYKGVVPLYPFFLNPKCIEASGVQATFANECYRGNKDCPTCGHH
jgi:hypothetical protein